jgi:hypothetical protein
MHGSGTITAPGQSGLQGIPDPGQSRFGRKEPGAWQSRDLRLEQGGLLTLPFDGRLSVPRLP